MWFQGYDRWASWRQSILCHEVSGITECSTADAEWATWTPQKSLPNSQVLHVIFKVNNIDIKKEPKAQVSYCHSAPSVVRPLTFTFSTSSPEPLDGFWWNLVRMKYSWSLTSVVVFRPDLPRGGSRTGQNRSGGSPSLRNFFFRPEGYSDKPNT